MNDDFLTRYRKAPRREFSETLYKRIHVPMNTPRRVPIRRLTFAAALCVALIAALAFSPSARAAFNGLIVQIGGMTFFESDETESQATPLPESQVTTVPNETLSLAEAQAKLPYDISLPTWAPDGFVRGSSVRVTYFGETYTPTTITWYGADPQSGNIDLIVGQRVNWEVDTDNVQEVEVNGQPAALVGGAWDANTGQWNRQAQITLSWMKGDVMYYLLSNGASVEDLLRMAESIP